MSNLQYWQEKIQEKRKATPGREFVMEIASRYPVCLYQNSKVSRFPKHVRSSLLKDMKDMDVIINDNLWNGDFFSSFLKLKGEVGVPYLYEFGTNVNCDYADSVRGSKNCYLSFSIINSCENILYTFNAKHNSRNVLNSVAVLSSSENIYESSSIINGYNIFYSHSIVDSNNIWSSVNLIGCSECIFCNDLEHKSYCINNTQLSKEQYFQQKKLFIQKQDFQKKNSDTAFLINATDSTGSFLINAVGLSNGRNSMNVNQGNNARFIGSNDLCNNFFDVFMAGTSHEFYGVVNSGRHSEYLYCCTDTINSNNLFYSMYCDSCSFCLGCIGLKNKSYCILNKQYSKEDRYIEVDKIFGQMENDGILGQFFPATMNPFYFNDTAAYLIDPSFTKEEVVSRGYLWRDEPIKVDIPPGVQTVKTSELGQFETFDSDGKRTINDEILKKVILDEQGNAYRIIPMELEFLRKYKLPLPRKHWLDRMKENFRIS